jgi:hypothetical protein
LKTCGFNGIGVDGLAASASMTSVAFVIGLFIIPLAARDARRGAASISQ